MDKLLPSLLVVFVASRIAESYYQPWMNSLDNKCVTHGYGRASAMSIDQEKSANYVECRGHCQKLDTSKQEHFHFSFNTADGKCTCVGIGAMGKMPGFVSGLIRCDECAAVGGRIYPTTEVGTAKTVSTIAECYGICGTMDECKNWVFMAYKSVDPAAVLGQCSTKTGEVAVSSEPNSTLITGEKGCARNVENPCLDYGVIYDGENLETTTAKSTEECRRKCQDHRGVKGNCGFSSFIVNDVTDGPDWAKKGACLLKEKKLGNLDSDKNVAAVTISGEGRCTRKGATDNTSSTAQDYRHKPVMDSKKTETEVETLQGCQEECDGSDDCNYFNVKVPTCEMMLEAKLEWEEGWTAGWKAYNVKELNPIPCDFSHGMYLNLGYSQMEGIASLAECWNKCQTEVNCASINYDTSLGKCSFLAFGFGTKGDAKWVLSASICVQLHVAEEEAVA